MPRRPIPASARSTTASGRTGRHTPGRATFDGILAEMGLNQAAATRGSGRTAADARPAIRQPTAEAVADISLEEAYHGTARRVEVDGRRLDVTIPRGAEDGTKIRLSGQGPNGGDLVVRTRVRPHA